MYNVITWSLNITAWSKYKASDESVRLLEVHTEAPLSVIVLRLKFYQLHPQLGEDIAIIFQSCVIFFQCSNLEDLLASMFFKIIMYRSHDEALQWGLETEPNWQFIMAWEVLAREIASVCVIEMKATTSNTNSAPNAGRILLASVKFCKCMSYNTYWSSQTYEFLNSGSSTYIHILVYRLCKGIATEIILWMWMKTCQTVFMASGDLEPVWQWIKFRLFRLSYLRTLVHLMET